jgi:hypothetical protein
MKYNTIKEIKKEEYMRKAVRGVSEENEKKIKGGNDDNQTSKT